MTFVVINNYSNTRYFKVLSINDVTTMAILLNTPTLPNTPAKLFMPFYMSFYFGREKVIVGAEQLERHEQNAQHAKNLQKHVQFRLWFQNPQKPYEILILVLWITRLFEDIKKIM